MELLDEFPETDEEVAALIERWIRWLDSPEGELALQRVLEKGTPEADAIRDARVY